MALIVVGWSSPAWPAYYGAGVMLLCLLLLRRHVTARFRPSNWLVRLTGDGLYLQFRSFLNWHFPAEDATVVFLPFAEIRSARLIRLRREIPGSEYGGDSGVTEQRLRLVELELACDPEPLAQALAAELARRAPTEPRFYGSTAVRYNHHPVRMGPSGRLLIEWGAAPGAREFLEALGRYIIVAPPLALSEDYGNLKALDTKSQRRRLLELVEAGESMAAIKVVRELYSMNLTEAKKFVEGLREEGGRDAAAHKEAVP